MGREYPTMVQPSNQNRRAERARRARETVNKAIPEILRQSPRARHGIHKADLIVDPPASNSTVPQPSSRLPDLAIDIRVQCADTLTAAARVSDRPFSSRRIAPTLKNNNTSPNVTVLNMASPLKPGGGFLEGANSQEEFLCARTTLYPSLWDSFYRLPELGGIYTPDVMVFRDSTPEANELAKRDRYFVDVITSGMLRFPETRGNRTDERPEGCSCGVSYCDRDRELVTRKMKAVMRLAQSSGTQKLVLGAWGCGAYGNPVKEVAKIWRKVIAGSPRQRRPNSERWEGIKEIIFAIPDRTMLREFERAFEDVLAPEPTTPSPGENQIPLIQTQDAATEELISKIAETEMQLEQIQNPRSKAKLREVLAALNRDLAQGLANKATQDQDLTQEDDEEVDDFTVVNRAHGFPASDGEDNSFYNFDENDVASDSSEGNASEVYEFRARPVYDSTTHDEDDELDDIPIPAFKASPQFNPQTGWFTGSIDHLSALLRGGGKSPTSRSHASPGSPVLRPDSSGQDIDEMTLKRYLSKYEGTDAVED